MPILKSSKKALRQAKRNKAVNDRVRGKVREVLREFRTKSSEEVLQKVFSILDRAVKKNIIHKNKASRLKSRLAKKLKSKNEKVKTTRPQRLSAALAGVAAKKPKKSS